MTTVFVLGNGPSSRRFRGIRLQPSIGCNYAIRDWDLNHLVCADRLAVHAIRQLPPNSNTRYWVKASILETPPGWEDLEFPGIDSGSAALSLAGNLYPEQEIIAIGFDGVLGFDNGNTYTYDFRPNPDPSKIRDRHRQAVISVSKQLNVKFASYKPDPELETINYDRALKIAITQSRILHKVSN